MNKKEENNSFNRDDKRPFVDGTNLNYIKQTSNNRQNNTSGYKGVCWDKYAKRYKAYIQIKNQFINLGYFENIEEAVIARKEAEAKYFEPILKKYKNFNLISYNGEEHSLKEWSEILSIPFQTLKQRYKNHSDDLGFVFSKKNHVRQVIIEYCNQKHNLKEWSKILNINYHVIRERYKKHPHDLEYVFKNKKLD